jgi:vacuolar-type H+-ATPase subunit H
MRIEEELSLLDQIRQTEAEVTRRVAAAHEAAQRTVEQAQAQRLQWIEQARVAGRKEGESRYKEIIAKAEEEARIIILHAQNRVDEIRSRGERCTEDAVEQALNIVLGIERGRKAR